MTKFHSDDYIKFLRSIRPDNMSDYNKQMQRCKLAVLHNMFQIPRYSKVFLDIREKCKALSWTFFQRNLVTIFEIFFLFCTVNVGEDCPVFDGMYEFCQLSTGGSVGKLKSFSSQPLVGRGGGACKLNFINFREGILILGLAGHLDTTN